MDGASAPEVDLPRPKKKAKLSHAPVEDIVHSSSGAVGVEEPAGSGAKTGAKAVAKAKAGAKAVAKAKAGAKAVAKAKPGAKAVAKAKAGAKAGAKAVAKAKAGAKAGAKAVAKAKAGAKDDVKAKAGAEDDGFTYPKTFAGRWCPKGRDTFGWWVWRYICKYFILIVAPNIKDRTRSRKEARCERDRDSVCV